MKRFLSSCLGTGLFLTLGVALGVGLVLALWGASSRRSAGQWNLAPGGAESAATAPVLAPATPTPNYAPISWKELVSFITADHTNWQDYEPDQYVCLNFALDLVQNARQAEIPAWVVAVFFENEEIGHAFVAFQTTDKGLVYIEPQTDIPYIQPQVGRPLCDLWTGQNCLGVIETILYLSCDEAGQCVEVPPPLP